MRAALFALLPIVLLAQTDRFDILITGARVIDGTGNPWYYADIGIKGDTIATVGPLPGAAQTAARTRPAFHAAGRGL